jgi:putative transposase
MNSVESLSHTKWECKYHVTWIPKYRKKQIYKELRKHLGEVLRDLARRKECKIVEGHLMPDHAHMLISIPPKYAVAQVIGYIKGKSAIQIARTYKGAEKELHGSEFLGSGILCVHSRCG